MCTRFHIDEHVIETVCALTAVQTDGLRLLSPGDIRPSMPAPVIIGGRGSLRAGTLFWGFPRYDGKGLVINARSESIREKAMFRESAERRRCIIPASAFYEWDSRKNPVIFTRESHPVLFLAGLFRNDRFTVLTTEANPSVSPVHPRMPVLLEENELEPWIWDPQATEGLLGKAMPLLTRFQENEQLSLF